MGDSKTKLDHFIERAVPSNIRDENPQFALFIEKYFEYISRDLGEYDLTSNLIDYMNIDKTVSAFYDDFKSMYAPLLPEKYKTSLSILVKNIKLFYQTKGTEESFKIFFRMIFDETVNLYYPKVDMLRASDGRWIEPYYLYPTDQSNTNLQYFYDKIIVGSVTNATAYVKGVIQVVDPQDSNSTIYVLSLVDRTGVFTNADTITVQGEVTPSTTLDAVDPVIVGDGYWEGTEGFLSWNKYIQDSHYYQDYSYVLESNVSADLIEKAIKENIHPAGMKLFALVTSSGQLENIGTELACFVSHVIDWIRNENVEQTINSISQELASQSVAPKYSSGNDFDWKYFELHREETAFIQLYPAAAFSSFPINTISDNYPENYVTITIGGTPTTAFSIINEQLTLDTPLGSDQFIIVTATDFTIPENSRVYRFSGTTGEDTFILPTKIHRMEIGAFTESPVYEPLPRNIATFDGTNYGLLDTPITFADDFRIDMEFSTTIQTAGDVFGGVGVDRLELFMDNTGRLSVYHGGVLLRTTDNPIWDGKIYHAYITRVGTTGTLYVGGIQQGLTFTLSGDCFIDTIGGRSDLTNLFNGQILYVKFSDARLRINDCLWNRDLSNGVWLQTNTPTIVQDQIGIDGVLNTAWTLGDDDVVNNESIYQDVTIPDDNNTHAIHTYILLEDDQATFPEIQLQLVGGATTQHVETQLNKKSGVIINREAVGTVSSSVESVLLGGRNWWKLTQTVQNNTTGNTTLRVRMYGAAGAVWNTWDATVTGSCVIDAVQIELDRSDTMWNIFTEGTPVSVDNPIPIDYVIDSGSVDYQLPVGEVLGNEEVSNGTFDTDITGFTDNSDGDSSAAWNGGQYIDLIVPTTNTARFDFTTTTIIGKRYVIDFDWVLNTGGYHIGTAIGAGNIASTQTLETQTFVALSTTTYFRFFNATPSSTVSTDNISVKQLPDSNCTLESFTSAHWNTYYYRKYLSHDDGILYTSWLGENIVTNGEFDTDTIWTKGSGWTISGGVATHVTPNTNKSIQQSLSDMIQSIYLLSYDIPIFNSGLFVPRLGGTWVDGNNAAGVYRKVVDVDLSTSLVQFFSHASADFDGTLDNVKVQHLLEFA